MAKRRTYRVNADGWWILKDILDGTPEEFNPDLSRTWTSRGMWSGYKYTGSLRGRTIHHLSEITFGQLPQEYVNAIKDSVVGYVIYSYETPIAWRRVSGWNRNGTTNYEWVMPDVKYSMTTSKHQGRVGAAISQINGGQNV